MSLCLVLPNENVYNVALRKIEANYIRYYAQWQNVKGFGKALKNLSGSDVYPDGKTDDSLLDDYEIVLPGIRNGQQDNDAYTTAWWSTDPLIRVTDAKYLIILPDDEDLRVALTQGVPLPNSVEEYQDNWEEVE